jgi:proline racemase
MIDRPTLEAEWLILTRDTLPVLAHERDWPVAADHCFQRILLDHAVGGCWYDHVAGRPAYRQLDDERLAAAVALGRVIVAGEADLHALNHQSLAWRGKAQPRRNPRSTLPSVDR